MLGKMNPMHISSDHSHTNCSSDWRIYNCVIPSSLIPMFPSTFPSVLSCPELSPYTHLTLPTKA